MLFISYYCCNSFMKSFIQTQSATIVTWRRARNLRKMRRSLRGIWTTVVVTLAAFFAVCSTDGGTNVSSYGSGSSGSGSGGQIPVAILPS